MVLAKMILHLLNQHDCLDTITIAAQLEDLRIEERLSFLRNNGYIKLVRNDEYVITQRGKDVLKKI